MTLVGVEGGITFIHGLSREPMYGFEKVNLILVGIIRVTPYSEIIV